MIADRWRCTTCLPLSVDNMVVPATLTMRCYVWVYLSRDNLEFPEAGMGRSPDNTIIIFIIIFTVIAIAIAIALAVLLLFILILHSKVRMWWLCDKTKQKNL
jgi:hypothetical protein